MATSKDAPDGSADIGGIIVSTFKMYKESWDAFTLNLITFILLMVVPIILVLLAVTGFFVIAVVDNSFVKIFMSLLMGLIVLAIFCLIAPAYVVTQLASARGKVVQFKEVFEESKSVVVPFIGLVFLSAIAIVLGLILFIIPGLVIAFFLTFSAYILVDKKIGIIDSMKASYELVKAKWEWVVALLLVQVAISIVGYVPFIGGLLSIAASVVYLCLPAIVYIKISKK